MLDQTYIKNQKKVLQSPMEWVT